MFSHKVFSPVNPLVIILDPDSDVWTFWSWFGFGATLVVRVEYNGESAVIFIFISLYLKCYIVVILVINW